MLPELQVLSFIEKPLETLEVAVRNEKLFRIGKKK